MSNELSTLGKYGLASGIVSAVGQMAVGYYASRAQKKTAYWQSVITEQNRLMAQRAAEESLMQSQYKIGQISMQAQKLKSSQRAAMAANGIVLGEGSAAEILTTTDVLEQESIAIERLNGYRQAWGFRTQAVNYAGQNIAAQTNGINPTLSAASGLMSGLVDTFDSAYKYDLLKKLGK